MQAVLLIGIQASGKTTFYTERFLHTHVRISLDLLRTRHREEAFLKLCLETRQPFVVDKTNPTANERRRFIEPAKAAGYEIAGYCFESRIGDALARNAGRPEKQRVPDAGIFGTAGRLERPAFSEGFDALYYVRIDKTGAFAVDEWREDA